MCYRFTGLYTNLDATTKVVAKVPGFVSSIINSGTVNIGLNSAFGGDWNSLWKAGISGLISGAWNVTGGFGLIKMTGSESALTHLARKLGYQMVGTTLISIGNNWTQDKPLFSRITLGIGPINLTLGKGQKLLQLEDNICNIGMHTFGLVNTAFGGKVNFDWKNFSVNYYGGKLDKLKIRNPNIERLWSVGFSPHAVTGNINLLAESGVYLHEIHHL